MNSKNDELQDAPHLSAEPARLQVEIEYFRRLAAAEVLDPIAVQLLRDWRRMQKPRLGWLVEVIIALKPKRVGFGRLQQLSAVSPSGTDRRCAPTLEAQVERDLTRLRDPFLTMMSDRLAQGVPRDADIGLFREHRSTAGPGSEDADSDRRSESLMQELHWAHDLLPVLTPLLAAIYVGRHYDRIVGNPERTRTILCIVAVAASLLALVMSRAGPRFAQ